MTDVNVVEHIQHIYEEGELDAAATCREFRQDRTEAFAELEYVNFNKAQIAKADELESDFDQAMKLLPKPKQAKQKKKHD